MAQARSSGLGQPPSPHRPQDPEGKHALRPVEQAQPFLRLEHDGLQAVGSENLSGRPDLIAVFELPLADQRQRQVGELSQIPRGSDGALRGNHRQEVSLQELNVALDQDRPYA